jgi:two-component system, chemotaxis family, chemotaxis protein CheY
VTHTVLICDDAPYMRTLLRDILERGGLEVVGEAANGLEAVVKYKAVRPDLVTMDIVMPEMSGLEAVREIVAHDARARVLMCSAMEESGLVAEALNAGASGFIIKPFKPSGVLEAIKRVVG